MASKPPWGGGGSGTSGARAVRDGECQEWGPSSPPAVRSLDRTGEKRVSRAEGKKAGVKKRGAGEARCVSTAESNTRRVILIDPPPLLPLDAGRWANGGDTWSRLGTIGNPQPDRAICVIRMSFSASQPFWASPQERGWSPK